MKTKQIYILGLFFTISFMMVGCAQTSIIGTWEIDKEQIKKDNPDIGPFTLDTASSLFYLLEFKENNKAHFMLFDIEKEWEVNTQNEIVIYSKEGNITARLITNNYMEIEAIDTQGKEDKTFKFHFNRIITKNKPTKLVLNKIYQTKEKDKEGWSYYIVFNKSTFFMFSTNSSETVNLEMFKTEKFDIKGGWGKERGNYTVKGNKIFTISPHGADKIKIISSKEIKINDNYLYIKE